MPALVLGIILHKRMTKRRTENSLNHNIKGHLTLGWVKPWETMATLRKWFSTLLCFRIVYLYEMCMCIYTHVNLSKNS